MNFFKKHWILLVSLFASFFLIVFDQGFYQREFWFDEAFTGILVKLGWCEMFYNIVADVHPPLYYVLLKIWGMLFGFSDIVLRSFSVFLSMLLIAVFYFFAKENIKNKKILFPLLFLASINPFLRQFAQEARMYMLFAVFTLLSAFFFWRLIKKKEFFKNRDWLYFSIFSSLSFLTHYFSLFVFISFFAALFLFYFQKQKLKLKEIFCFYMKFFAIPIITFILWLPFFVKQIKPNLGWIPPVEFDILPRAFFTFLFGSDQGVLGIPNIANFNFILNSNEIAILIFSVLLILAASINKKTDKFFLFNFMLVFIPIFLTILVSKILHRHMFVARYFLFCVPFLITILLIYFSKFKSKIFYSIIIIWVLLSFNMAKHIPATNYRELAKKTENIVATDPFMYLVSKFYINDSVLLFNFDNTGDNFSGWPLFNQNSVMHNFNKLPDNIFIVSTKELKDQRLMEKEKFYNFFIYKKIPD
ncbi:glycosyltransferase family 39 protein [Candidatus Parcubacteria bacterium]|nr:glycosyltransferase family 39 protein [Candidatus Parcubacteria bacterium]